MKRKVRKWIASRFPGAVNKMEMLLVVNRSENSNSALPVNHPLDNQYTRKLIVCIKLMMDSYSHYLVAIFSNKIKLLHNKLVSSVRFFWLMQEKNAEYFPLLCIHCKCLFYFKPHLIKCLNWTLHRQNWCHYFRKLSRKKSIFIFCMSFVHPHSVSKVKKQTERKGYDDIILSIKNISMLS